MNEPPDPCSAHPILLLPYLSHQSKNECQIAAEIIHYPKGCYKARSCYVGLPPFMNLSFADPPTGSLRSARVQLISIREKLSFFEHPHPFDGSYPHEASQPRLLCLIPSSPSSRPLSAQLLKTNLLFCPLLDVSFPSVLVYKTYVAFSSWRSLEQVKVSGYPRVMIEYDEHSKAILWPPGHESATSSLKSVLFWTVLQPDPLSREVFMKILPHSSSHRHQVSLYLSLQTVMEDSCLALLFGKMSLISTFMMVIDKLHSSIIRVTLFLHRLLCSMLRINLDKLLSFSSLVDSYLMVSVLEFIDKPYLGIIFLNISASTKPCVVDTLFSNPSKALLFVFWANFFLAMAFWHKKTLGWKPGHPIFMSCMSRFCSTMSFFGFFFFGVCGL